MSDRLHDQFMIQVIKETLDIQIDHIVGPPAPLPRRGDRVQRRSSGSIPVTQTFRTLKIPAHALRAVGQQDAHDRIRPATSRPNCPELLRSYPSFAYPFL